MTHGLFVSGRRVRDTAVSLTSAALLLSALVAQAAPPAGKVTSSSSARFMLARSVLAIVPLVGN